MVAVVMVVGSIKEELAERILTLGGKALLAANLMN
jgi:hypothetical protein